ncbi:DNA-3-methyladenine glycosylase 2 family protein [Billgrantia tianxiuensis]|uniref:DNA-3-methyladenine glycosylase II n=1 Tax=Billgrantia tianxiuensis TaxID=2497861 RepID=A0A6I6SNT2_9GAMM|nr:MULTISPECIES: DNA-3-methyladenine glycosylase 2 family protein [Halomonas]MCE8033503.1 DNA-3-methyladenine glycosylase 2 family protein [Halomonas sp. MCCC 1A11057]QHC49207.1 DNA-3-methyladenine glycosylase 2 family protein [Halomonas tianxiuensis]
MSEEIHLRFVEVARELSPSLADAFERGGPVTLQADDSQPLAERLCRSIAGQQLSVKAARSIWTRVVDAAGETPLMEFFVEPNQEVLRGCGLSGAKLRALCLIAEEARAGRLEAAELRRLDHAQRSQRLTALWGVGQWTADMISIFYFGEPDVWPEGDVAARKTLERLTSPRRKTLRTATRFAPHRSYLALYLWRHVDAPPV